MGYIVNGRGEMSICFFIGHRDAPASLYQRISTEVERHIKEYGVTEFVVCHYGSFDRMAARAIRENKRQHPEIALTLLLPYYQSDISKYGRFDGAIYPPGMETTPKRFAIIRANRYMIAHCDYLITYAWHIGSNTRDFIEYAQHLERRTGRPHIINLAEPDF